MRLVGFENFRSSDPVGKVFCRHRVGNPEDQAVAAGIQDRLREFRRVNLVDLPLILGPDKDSPALAPGQGQKVLDRRQPLECPEFIEDEEYPPVSVILHGKKLPAEKIHEERKNRPQSVLYVGIVRDKDGPRLGIVQPFRYAESSVRLRHILKALDVLHHHGHDAHGLLAGCILDIDVSPLPALGLFQPSGDMGDRRRNSRPDIGIRPGVILIEIMQYAAENVPGRIVPERVLHVGLRDQAVRHGIDIHEPGKFVKQVPALAPGIKRIKNNVPVADRRTSRDSRL